MARDWRRAEHYAGLGDGGRHAFAWEWLRRSAAYRAAWAAAEPFSAGDGAPFGLHRLECPDLPTPAARPIWRAEADPAVILAHVAGREGPAYDLLYLNRVRHLATCHRAPDGEEHWLFSDGWRQVRLDLRGGSLLAGPIRLDYQLSGLASALPGVTTLHRLVALTRTGRLNATLFPRERRARRWALVLRAYDALAEGASHREIAETLLSMGASAQWRVDAPGYRRKAQRLAEAARRIAATDPRLWLWSGLK